MTSCGSLPGTFRCSQHRLKFNISVLQIQAQILTFPSLLTWSQCYLLLRKALEHCKVYNYSSRDARFDARHRRCSYLALRTAIKRHTAWLETFMAVLAAISLAAGVLCRYWDIYTHRSERGVSSIFVDIALLWAMCFLLYRYFSRRNPASLIWPFVEPN